jgi:hypothetical protein
VAHTQLTHLGEGILTKFFRSWFLFLNVATFGAGIAGYIQGLLPHFVSIQSTPYVIPIVVTFVLGFVYSVYLYWKSTTTKVSDFGNISQFKAWWHYKLDIVRWAGYMLIMAGLLGTILGFMAALSPDVISAASATDAGSIKLLLTTLMGGTGIALQTTFIGTAAGGFWLEINAKLAESQVFKEWIKHVRD